MKKQIILLFLSFFFVGANAQTWKTYPYEPEGSLIIFPSDEGRHSSEPSEWWYTVGHLTGVNTGTNYSYMLTYFYTPQGPYQGFRILNVSNDDTGEFYASTEPLIYAVLATDSLNILAKTGITLTGTEFWRNKTDVNGMIPFEYVLSANSANGAVNLEYIAQKPPLILGGDGLFDQGSSNYTYYYSQTKNSVSGTFTFKGVTEPVTGTSWIDRQYGTFNPSTTTEKYEWFSLQLSNGMDINFWDLFTADNKIPNDEKYRNISVYVDEDSSYTNFDFNVERLKFNFTNDNQRCYSQKWRLTSDVNSIDVIIETLHSNTEVSLPFRFYEGATKAYGTVNGVDVTGIGFAELLHSYSHPDISISQPSDNKWESQSPLTWTVNNPDDGRALYFDLYYSTDNINFTKVDSAIQDTSYNWTAPTLNDNDEFWLKVEAYSLDTTLTDNDVSNLITYINPATGIYSANISKPRITLYPNPANSIINFESNTLIKQVRIFDISGNLHLKLDKINSTHFNLKLNDFNGGIYFFEIQTNKGTDIRRVLVQ